MHSPTKIPWNNLSWTDGEKLQEKLLILEAKFKSWDINWAELQSRNVIINELKKRTWYIDELARKYEKLDKEWDRIDWRWREYDQEQIAKERNEIWVVLCLLWYDTDWKPLKSPEIKLQIAWRVGQLTLPWFQAKEWKRRRRK